MDIRKVFSFFLILLPVTNIYGCGIPGISIGKVILVLLVIGSIIKNRCTVFPKIPKYAFLFMSWVLIVPFFYISAQWFSYTDALYKLVGVLGFWLTLGYSLQIVDVDYLFKVYGRFAFIFSLVFLFQTVVYYATGKNIVFIIPFLPLADASDSVSYIDGQSVWNRQCSVFLEPAYFSFYIGIFLCLLLNKCSDLFNKKVLFYIVILILLRSGNGYLCLLMTILSYFVMHYRRILSNRRNLIGIFFVIIIGAFAYFHLSVDSSSDFGETFNRVSELGKNAENDKTSGFERIYRGYYIYDDLPSYAKILGIGQGNILSFSRVHQFRQYMNIGLENDAFYMNCIQQILVYSGIIGLMLFIYFILRISTNKIAMSITLLFVSLSFVTAIYNTPYMLFFLLFGILYSRKQFTLGRRGICYE